MNRRGFLARLCAAPIVALAVLRAPMPHTFGSFGADPLVDPEPLGISIRYVQHIDTVAQDVTRFDVVYGFATLNPELACRFESEPLPWYSLKRWIA